MAGTPTTYRGEDAVITIGGQAHSVIGLSDFGLTISRGTVEEPLVGESGNYNIAGSMSITGSFTAAKLDNTAAGLFLAYTISGGSYGKTSVSGSVGPNSLHFYFASCALTGFDLKLGDADTITEGSIDFQVLDPYQVTTVTDNDTGGTYITDE